MNRFIKAFRKVSQTFNEMPRGSAVGGTFRHALFVLLLLITGVGSAWAQTSVWDGKDEANKFPSGSGTEDDPYIISNASEFAYLGKKDRAAYYKLTINIDLGGYEWKYGENSSTTFKGHFDGNGKTVKNFKIVPKSGKVNGLFCTIQGTSSTARAEVKNLTIDSVTISTTSDLDKNTYTGGLVGNVGQYADFVNVNVKNVKISCHNFTNANYIGAFAGRVQKNSTIKTCSVDKSAIDITGDMTTASSYIGGAIGQFAGTSAEEVSSIDGLTVSSSSVTINKVSIKECRIGAVLGHISTYSGVKNVTVSKPSLTYKDTDSPNVDVRFGTFAGEVNGNADKQVKVNNITMSDATMTIGTGSNSIANIKAGAIGRVSTNVLLDTLSFSGNNKITIDGDLATSTSYIGGLAGYVASASSVSTTFKNLTLSASATMSVTVTGSTNVSPNIGGFFGFMQSATNAPLVIKDITMKGKSSVEVKGSAPASAYLGGFAAYVRVQDKNTNAPITIDGVDMSGCTTTLSIDGDISAESYMGGCIGRLYNIVSDTYKGDTITVSKVKVGKSNISVTGNITGESYFAGLIGRVHQLCAIDSCTVSNPTLTFDGNISSKSPYIGGAIGRITGTVGYPSSLRAITVTKPTLKMNGKVGKTSYLGGMLGYADTYVSVNSNKVENPAISITKDESHGTLYIGGAVGYAKGVVADRTLIKGNTVSKASLAMNGKVGNTFYMGGFLGYAENANVYNNKVAEPAISVTNDINAEAYIGGAVGRQGGYTTIDGMTVSGGSITGPTSDKTIINNKAIFFGGFIGQQNSSGTVATQPNKFMNVAVTDMNINLEHYVPGGNITNNKFGVGGIAGSVNAPNRDANGFCGMPENIIFKGGKIYAPYATTSPTVSNFNASNPGHNTMTTEVITTVDALDKAKTKTWYYSDYELGLSPGLLQSASIVAKGTAPAKDRFRLNCDATLKSTSVQYITVNNSTFEKQNRYQDSERDSKTVLWWTTTAAVGKAAAQQFTNEEQPCYPHQAGEAATQYPYYWYFFQGVANANYAKAAVADSIISGIAANMTQAVKAKPITLTIKNDKEGERGFDERTITVAAKTVDDEGNETDATGITYQWYLNGADAGTGSSIKLTPHWKDGQGLTVNALSGKTVVATATYTLAPGVMKTKAGDAEKIRTDYTTRGTKANPYIIDCENALRQLSYLSTANTNTRWEGITVPSVDPKNQIVAHYNRAYYELGADIKMSSDPFTPISHVGYGSDGTWGTYTGNFIFQGCFDGKGHKISGLNITWGAGQYNGNDANVYYGLFGAVGNIQEGKTSAPAVGSIKWGESSTTNTVIKNVVLDNATLTHDVNNKTFSYSEPYSHITGDNANNCMVGVLVGLVGSHTTIDNIEIRGSHIKDTGSSDYSLATKGLFVGGAIGSVQVAFNKTAFAPEVNISHIAAQVDIELTHPKFANEKADAQLGMFNVGGIIGRYIATSATQAQAQAAMPSHTLFSGTVNAPKAWISPVLASLRYVSQNGVKFADYSLQYEGNNKTAATQIKITDAQFYNYFIRDRKMTDAFPDVKCALGTRTIVRHADGAENEREYTTFSYQGVNYGAVYIDEVGTSLELLNKDMDEKEGFSWQWDEDGKFVHMSTEPYVSVYLTRKGNTFTANFNGDAQRYTWMGSLDGTTWYEIKNQGTEKYEGHTSLKDIYVRVIVSDRTKSYKSLIEKIEGDMALYTPEIKDAEVGDNTTLTLNLNSKPGVPVDVFDIAYQWYKSPDETTGKIDGESTNVMTINTETLKTEYSNTLWCKTTVTDKDLGIVIADFLTIYGGTVIYVNGNKYKRDDGINVGTGNDNNDGLTPATPVLTIDKANSLLKSVEKGGTWDNNFIVIMGVLDPDFKFQSEGKNPATLTGKWNNVDYEGVIYIDEIHPEGNLHVVNPIGQLNKKGHNCYVLGDTKFQYLTISGDNGDNLFIECHGNDVWFGKGLVMDNFRNLSSNHGNYNEKTKFYPEFTVILTATNLSRSKIEEYCNRTKPQVLTVESGHYGRILAGRYTQDFFKSADNDSHGIFGSPKNPFWAVINIDIDKDNPNPGNAWTKDINCVVAGLTDGSMYGDMEINIHGGDIDYVVGANQGNPVPNGDKEFTHVDGDFGKWGQWPNSSFFGRSVINVDQNSNLKDVTIGNIYAGGLGRKNQGSTNVPSIVDMYLYGRTEINMKGGSIDASLYGGGAGGVIGLSPWDAHVPYATVENTEDDMENGIINGVQYGTWGTKKDGDKLPTVILHNPNDAGGYDVEELNLSKSSTTLNISGGNVNGNVFGGGCGFTENMEQIVCMQAVGSVFGNSNVNITGGTIQGSVYGGGQGDKKYFGATNFYGQTIEHIAETNGYINVNVTGTEEKCPVIHGDIYGAGMGIKSEGEQEYLRIATTGNKDLKLISEDGYPTAVNLVIDLPESKPFSGNIYGGGQFGMVDGDTNVVLKRGTFTGNVFGGGKGENDHPDKAKVVGSTHVKVGETEISE